MAKTLSRSTGCKTLERKPAATKAKSGKPNKPKKLSKIGEWRLANPCANGANGVIYDMRAVMK